MSALTRTARPAPALSARVQEVVNMAHRVGFSPVVSDVDQGGDFDVWLHPVGRPEQACAPYVLVVDAADQDGDLMLIKQNEHGICAYTWDGFPDIVRKLGELGWDAEPEPAAVPLDDGADGDYLI